MSVAHVAATGTYWTTARFDRLAVFDPRTPSNVTDYVKDSNMLCKYPVGPGCKGYEQGTESSGCGRGGGTGKQGTPGAHAP